jgi:hypothetical protein
VVLSLCGASRVLLAPATAVSPVLRSNKLLLPASLAHPKTYRAMTAFVPASAISSTSASVNLPQALSEHTVYNQGSNMRARRKNTDKRTTDQLTASLSSDVAT